MPAKSKIAIAVSGKGRSLQNFVEHEGPYEVAAVICSNPKAGAVGIAQDLGMPVYDFKASEVDAESLNAWLQAHEIEWIALAGFLEVFPSLPSYSDRVINIHPALLPAYGGHGMYGARVHEAVLAAEEKVSGASIHFVNERYDEGAIIAQGRVSLEGVSSADEIAARVFTMECELYPLVLSKLITQELPLKNGQIWLYGSQKC